MMTVLMASEDVEEPALIKGYEHAITDEGLGETEAEPAHQDSKVHGTRISLRGQYHYPSCKKSHV